MQNDVGGGTPIECTCVDPNVFNIANTTPDGTTSTLTVPFNNGTGLFFDMNVPEGSSNPVQNESFDFWFYNVPEQPNAFKLPVVSDASGSVLVMIQWLKTHDFVVAIGPGASGLHGLVYHVLGNIPNNVYPQLPFFFQHWPKGWTTKNISATKFHDQPRPANQINCLLQDGKAHHDKTATASAYSLCSYCTNNMPDSSCSHGGGGGGWSWTYIILGLIAFIAGVALIKNVI